MGVPRVVTVRCPDWPVVAARIPAEQPAVVLRSNRVVARTRAAAVAGVPAGARRRAAQAACPGLLVVDDDPDRDARGFEPVVRAVADMAPRLDVVEPGRLDLLARGPSRYFGGDRAMAERVVAVVRGVLDDAVGSEVGAVVGVGVADGRSAAAIAAHLASHDPAGVLVVPPGGSAGLVHELPVAWLRELGEVPAELVDLLARLGLRTLGDLARLAPGDVLARFGPDGRHAHRLASGADERPPDTTDPPPEWWVEHAFAEPVEQLEVAVFVAKRLADDLTSRLAADGRVCTRLVVVAETEHGERSERAWYRDQGLSSPAMVERVRWQLEGWASQVGGPSGGIAYLRLAPDEIRADDGVQGRLWGGRSRADDDAARAIVRLSGLAGEEAVRVPAWVGGRLPTERYRWVPAASVDPDGAATRLDRGAGPWPGRIPSPAPTVVPSEPLPVEVLDGDGAVVRVSGRGEVSAGPAVVVMPSGRRRIVAWAGPWTVEQRWWSPDRSRRIARFQIVTDAGTAHLVGVERQRWLLLATYS